MVTYVTSQQKTDATSGWHVGVSADSLGLTHFWALDTVAPR